jgi:ring-1,2-phenylacetyl-CoA epoxidase subunit PaaE
LTELSSADEYLICGPGDMVDEVRNAISTLNGKAQIRFERFAAGSPRPLENAAKEPAAAPEPQPPLATISVMMDGRRRSFPMAQGDASVLEAAERAGLELPFSCRSGICATCRARITEGAAVMTHNIALEPWETDAGFVLCCQARPTTATLDISYDHK